MSHWPVRLRPTNQPAGRHVHRRSCIDLARCNTGKMFAAEATDPLAGEGSRFSGSRRACLTKRILIGLK
jgi:hypothetical protein